MADLNDRNKLGTYHITEDIQNYEVARSNYFQLVIQDLDDLIYPEFSYGQEDGSNVANQFVSGTAYGKRSASDVIRLSVNTMFVPTFGTTPIEIKRGNSSVKFASTPEWKSGSITVQDFIGLETKNILNAWKALWYDVNSDTCGRAGDWVDAEGVAHKGYKRDAKLVEYTPDHEMIRYWDLKGCWISNIDEANFDVQGTGARELTCEFQYDRAYMHQAPGKIQ